MITFELLALELPYFEIKKTWMISKAIIDGVPPSLPPLDQEYQGIIELFEACISFNPSLRPKTNAVLSKLQMMNET